MVPSSIPELCRSKRLSLRHPRLGDREELLDLRRTSWDFLRPWEPRRRGIDPCGRDWFRSYYESAQQSNTERLLLIHRTEECILGSISLNEIVRGSFRSAYLGYWIGEPHARHGYMTEGLQLALRHAFRRLRLHRLEANVCPENEPSLALLQRVGFRREGYSPRYLKIAGRWRDHERWAILAEEWPRPR